MLLLETGMIGVFAALDLFLFYLFWEVMLIPMYFLIGVWGGERRIYAAMKFVLFTMIGGVLMLVAILALYFMHGNATGNFTFSYPAIHRVLPGVCRQGSAFSFPYLASRRARRSTDGRFRASRRRVAEDGDLRVASIQPAFVPEHEPPACADHFPARYHRHHLWRARCHGAA